MSLLTELVRFGETACYNDAAPTVLTSNAQLISTKQVERQHSTNCLVNVSRLDSLRHGSRGHRL